MEPLTEPLVQHCSPQAPATGLSRRVYQKLVWAGLATAAALLLFVVNTSHNQSPSMTPVGYETLPAVEKVLLELQDLPAAYDVREARGGARTLLRRTRHVRRMAVTADPLHPARLESREFMEDLWARDQVKPGVQMHHFQQAEAARRHAAESHQSDLSVTALKEDFMFANKAVDLPEIISDLGIRTIHIPRMLLRARKATHTQSTTDTAMQSIKHAEAPPITRCGAEQPIKSRRSLFFATKCYPAESLVLTFDTAEARGKVTGAQTEGINAAVAETYGGLLWKNFWYVQPRVHDTDVSPLCPSGMCSGLVSGAFNAYTDDGSFGLPPDQPGSFTLVSMYVTSAFEKNDEVLITADTGATKVVKISNTKPHLVDFGPAFAGIRSVRMSGALTVVDNVEVVHTSG